MFLWKVNKIPWTFFHESDPELSSICFENCSQTYRYVYFLLTVYHYCAWSNKYVMEFIFSFAIKFRLNRDNIDKSEGKTWQKKHSISYDVLGAGKKMQIEMRAFQIKNMHWLVCSNIYMNNAHELWDQWNLFWFFSCLLALSFSRELRLIRWKSIACLFSHNNSSFTQISKHKMCAFTYNGCIKI